MIIALIGLQILNQTKLMEEIGVKLVERAINQPIAKDQTNQDFELAFQGQNVVFKGGYCYLDLVTSDLIGYRFKQVVKLNR